jgi:hypothetical protein
MSMAYQLKIHGTRCRATVVPTIYYIDALTTAESLNEGSNSGDIVLGVIP